MTELAALNVKINGDSGGLVAAVNAADGAVTSFGRVTSAAEAKSRNFDMALRRTRGGATELQREINSLTGVLNRSQRSAEGAARFFDRLGDEALNAGSQMGVAGNNARVFAVGMNSAQGSLGNFAAQFNDIGVMLAAGQNPLQLALQQGTQINQAFDAMGAAGATASGRLRALGAALASVVSPANLLTIGVIAGGAALFQFGLSAIGARDQVTQYADALETLETITGDVQRASDILNTSMFDLIEQYGSAADRVRELALAEIELAIARQRGAVAQAMQNEELQNALSEYGGLTRVVGMMGEIFYDTSDAVRAIERDLHVTGQTAADLAVAFQQLRNASTMEETLAAWEQINGLLSEAGISLSDLPPSLAQALSGVINLEQAMIDYTAAVSKAAQETQALAAAMPMTTGGVGPSVIGPDGQIRMPPETTNDNDNNNRGGGASLADRIERDLERLREGFMSEEELQIAAYERQQELLEEALNKRLLTQQEFAELMQQAQRQHQERMAEIDVYRYGTGLQQAQQFFGDMASALQGGNEEMARISRVFAAGEALVNAWRAYTQTIADPTLPFFAKIPAALSVLSAGMRAVSAINSGSTSAAGASAGGASAGAAAAAASVGPQIMLNIQPNARGDIPMATFRGVIDDINRSLDRGGRIIAA